MIDGFGRDIRYLRVSVTDLCNLHCHYCMPMRGLEPMKEEALSDDDVIRLIRAFADCGIEVVRLTGGEPLMRKGLSELVRRIREIPEIRHITMTTNGVLLKEQLPSLREAGLSSVNISLDSLCGDTFRKITGTDLLERVLAGLNAAVESGLPTKVNVVPQLGYNEEELADLALLAKDRHVQVRFIEMMPIGYGSGEPCLETERILAHFKGLWPEIEQAGSAGIGAGPAVYYHVPGWEGNIGFISAVHGKFCADCNRLRLTSRGFLRLCLGSEAGEDLRALLQSGASDEEIREAIRRAVLRKPKEHHFGRPDQEKTRSMSQIGG